MSNTSIIADTERLAVNAFKDEGAFLHRARLASNALAKRIADAHPNVRTFVLSRDELTELSTTLTRAVNIGAEYHIDHADLPAA